MADDCYDSWSSLIAQAKDQAPCSRQSSTCHVKVIVGPFYALIQHVDLHFHDCDLCVLKERERVVPEHIVSYESLQTLRRIELAERVARFLRHAHGDQLDDDDEPLLLDAAA